MATPATSAAGSKIFHDPIHGSMEFEPFLVKIIDTPEFQRLRRIKQLGAGCYVYPGATHTRFEHSLGVCYLAGKFAEHLKVAAEQDGLDVTITSPQIKCIKVAGLCHDLGHGPFSHMFEDFVHKARPDISWKHEEMSVKILKKILDRVDDPDLKKKENQDFIEDLIKGIKPRQIVTRNKGKEHYLYQIVANKDTGIDVDKWDYFARDCHYLGLSNDFQWTRCMMLARVKKVGDNDYQICYRDSAIPNIYAMFRTRSTLHQKAYQHIQVKAVDHMIIDCLIHMMRQTPPALPMTLKDVHVLEDEDIGVYVKLDDSIVESLQKPVPELDKLRKRELYPYLGFAKLKDLQLKALKKKFKPEEDPDNVLNKHLEGFIEEKIKERITSKDVKKCVDIAVVEVKFGSEEKSPLENLWCYSSTQTFPMEEDLSDQIHLGGILVPKKFHQCEVRLYSKENDETKCDSLREAFKGFLIEHNDCFGDLNVKNFGKYFSLTKGK